MNTYRVDIRLQNWGRSRSYNVDASRPGEAIRRALANFPDSPNVVATCLLYAKGINRHHSDKRVREVAE